MAFVALSRYSVINLSDDTLQNTVGSQLRDWQLQVLQNTNNLVAGFTNMHYRSYSYVPGKPARRIGGGKNAHCNR